MSRYQYSDSQWLNWSQLLHLHLFKILILSCALISFPISSPPLVMNPRNLFYCGKGNVRMLFILRPVRHLAFVAMKRIVMKGDPISICSWEHVLELNSTQ